MQGLPDTAARFKDWWLCGVFVGIICAATLALFGGVALALSVVVAYALWGSSDGLEGVFYLSALIWSPAALGYSGAIIKKHLPALPLNPPDDLPARAPHA